MDVGPRWCVLDLADGEMVARLVPDMGLLADLSHKYKLTGVTVFGRCNGREPSLRVRSFAPAAGVPEDPACGSGNVCVGRFWSRHPPARDRNALLGCAGTRDGSGCPTAGQRKRWWVPHRHWRSSDHAHRWHHRGVADGEI